MGQKITCWLPVLSPARFVTTGLSLTAATPDTAFLPRPDVETWLGTRRNMDMGSALGVSICNILKRFLFVLTLFN